MAAQQGNSLYKYPTCELQNGNKSNNFLLKKVKVFFKKAMAERRREQGRVQAANYFQPSSEWVQDPSNYILLIQLPGFKKDNIKIIVDDNGRLTVMGTKQDTASFEQSYSIPTGSNIDKIKGKFENDCLVLIFPKSATVEPEKKTIAHEDEKEEPPLKDKKEAETEKKQKKKEKKLDKLLTMEEIERLLGERETRKKRLIWDLEKKDLMDWLNSGSVDSVWEQINRNRKVIAAALIAFSFGFYASSKLRRGH